MAALIENTEILDIVDVDSVDGVRFGSPRFHSSQLTLDWVRWVDMGRPRAVTITVTPVVPNVGQPEH